MKPIRCLFRWHKWKYLTNGKRYCVKCGRWEVAKYSRAYRKVYYVLREKRKDGKEKGS